MEWLSGLKHRLRHGLCCRGLSNKKKKDLNARYNKLLYLIILILLLIMFDKYHFLIILIIQIIKNMMKKLKVEKIILKRK